MSRHDRTTTSSLLLTLPLVALLGGCGSGDGEGAGSSSSTKSSTSAKATENRGPRDPVFGYPLIVDGKEISKQQLRSFLVNGYGQPYLEYEKMQILIKEEIEARKAAGQDVSGLAVSEEEFQAALLDADKEVKKQFPLGDVSLSEVSPVKDMELFHAGLRQTLEFDKVFLPANPYEFGPITESALKAAANGDETLLENLRQTWDNQQAEGIDPEADKGYSFLKTFLRSMVQDHVYASADIRLPGDQIPDHLAMQINGTGIETDAIWEKIKDQVTPMDVYQAKQWFVNTTLAKQAVKDAGFWLDDDEFDRVYREEHDPYKDSPFSLERVALNFRKFPSISAYRTHYRLTQSYKRMIADELTTDALKTRIDRINLLIAGKVDADVILLSAYDFKNREWIEGGWEKAEERAVDVIQKLAEGLTWEDAVEQYSDFYDAPIPESAKESGQEVPRNNKGRFLQVSRNDFVNRLQESDYQTFLTSSSVADFIFFEQEMGSTHNPLEGPYGYYIPKVHKRVLHKETVNIEDDNHRTLLEQDLVTSRLNRFVWELRDESEIQGLEL